MGQRERREGRRIARRRVVDGMSLLVVGEAIVVVELVLGGRCSEVEGSSRVFRMRLAVPGRSEQEKGCDEAALESSKRISRDPWHQKGHGPQLYFAAHSGPFREAASRGCGRDT